MRSSQFTGDKLSHEHIYWDQASVLLQLGLLEADGLPIAGAPTAHKVLDIGLPAILDPVSTGGIVLVALAIAVGLVGIVVPLLPGILLVYAAILVWAVVEHNVTAWVTLGVVDRCSSAHHADQVHVADEANAGRRRRHENPVGRRGARHHRLLRDPGGRAWSSASCSASTWPNWRIVTTSGWRGRRRSTH